VSVEPISSSPLDWMEEVAVHFLHLKVIGEALN
jgi:hypothetical protein